MAGLFRFRLFFSRKRKFIFWLFLFYGRKSKINFWSASNTNTPGFDAKRITVLLSHIGISFLGHKWHKSKNIVHITAPMTYVIKTLWYYQNDCQPVNTHLSAIAC